MTIFPRFTPWPEKRAAFIGLLLLAAVFIVIRCWFAVVASQKAGPIVDTWVFFEMGDAPLFSKTFLGGDRPPLVPLMFKLCRNDIAAIILIQTLCSIICWCYFAWNLMLCVRGHAVRIAVLCVTVLLSICEPVIVWESCLLSESISLSLMVAMIGAWLSVLRAPGPKRFLLLGLLAVLWAFSRETNAWMVLCIGLLCVPVAVYKKDRKYGLLAFALFVSFVLADVSSSIGERWKFPFLNVLSQRILPDSSRTAWLVRHGMPMTPALVAMTGTCASCRDYAFYKDPALESFRTWLDTRGKRTYMLWMLAHPATTIREPLSNIEALVAAGSQFLYASPSSRRILPAWLSKMLFPICYERYFSLACAWLLVLCTGMVIGARMWRHGIVWIVPIALVLLAYPHWLIVWHGDNIAEVGRHSLAARMQLNLAVWIMASLSLDPLISRFRSVSVTPSRRGGGGDGAHRTR